MASVNVVPGIVVPGIIVGVVVPGIVVVGVSVATGVVDAGTAVGVVPGSVVDFWLLTGQEKRQDRLTWSVHERGMAETVNK